MAARAIASARVAGKKSVVLATEDSCEIGVKAEAIYSTGNVFKQSRKLLFSGIEVAGSFFNAVLHLILRTC